MPTQAICDRCGEDISSDTHHIHRCGFENHAVCGECYEPDSVRDLLKSYSQEAEKFDELDSDHSGNTLESTRSVGVEIECYAPNPRRLQTVQQKADPRMLYKQDGSLNHGGVEAVSPPMAGEKAEQVIRGLTSAMHANNFEVDHTCGFHLHVDMSDVFTEDYTNEMREFQSAKEKLRKLYSVREMFFDTEAERAVDDTIQELEEEKRNARLDLDDIDFDQSDTESVKALIALYLALDPVVSSFIPKTRRSNTYCKPTAHNYSLNDVLNCNEISELEMLHYNTENYEEAARAKQRGGSGTSHRGINFHTMLSDGHFEVRYHSGTTNAKKILNWANLHATIADTAVENTREAKEVALELANVPNLRNRTTKMFDFLGIHEKAQKYFTARQCKFNKADSELYNLSVDELLEGMPEEELSKEG